MKEKDVIGRSRLKVKSVKNYAKRGTNKREKKAVRIAERGKFVFSGGDSIIGTPAEYEKHLLFMVRIEPFKTCPLYNFFFFLHQAALDANETKTTGSVESPPQMMRRLRAQTGQSKL